MGDCDPTLSAHFVSVLNRDSHLITFATLLIKWMMPFVAHKVMNVIIIQFHIIISVLPEIMVDTKGECFLSESSTPWQ